MPPIENVIADTSLQEESKAAPAKKAATAVVATPAPTEAVVVPEEVRLEADAKGITARLLAVRETLSELISDAKCLEKKAAKLQKIAEEGEEGRKESKNALIAKNGNNAERILCGSPDVLIALEQYYGRKITNAEVIKGGKKSDIRFTFADGTTARAQLKNGIGDHIGWSCDKRNLENMPTNNDMKSIVKTLCLKDGGERNVVPNDKSLIPKLLLGEDEETKPQDYIHSTTEDGKIKSISICPADKFIESILNDAYENCLLKLSCVHLSPLIYLKRKGGEEMIRHPTKIQAMLSAMPDCMTVINLNGTNSAQ